MAKLPFTVGELLFGAQNVWSDGSQPYCFFITFCETNRFFALAGSEQPLVNHVLHNYGLGMWIG